MNTIVANWNVHKHFLRPYIHWNITHTHTCTHTSISFIYSNENNKTSTSCFHTTSILWSNKLLLESNCKWSLLIWQKNAIKNVVGKLAKWARHYQGNTIENWGYFLSLFIGRTCHFVLWPLHIFVSSAIDPIPNFTEQNPLVHRSLPIALNCLRLLLWILFCRWVN